MKYFLALLLLPLFSFAQTDQQLIDGLWIKAKAQLKDGSRIVDHQGCGMNFIKYDFTSDGLVDIGDDVLFGGFKSMYKLKGDSLIVGGTIYNLISLTKDTMKVSFFVPGAEDKQLPEFVFVKLPEYRVQTKVTFDANLKDSVYQATNELFPQCKDNINALLSAIATRYDKGTLKASFVVDKKGRVKNFTFIEMDSISKGFAKTVGNAFGSLKWQPATESGAPVNSIVQVTLKSSNNAYGSNGILNSLAIEYPFLPQPPYPPLDKDEAEAAQQYFRDAISQINSGNNEKALDFLNKCIEIDNINLNAYYLRAVVNSNMGKSKDACKDWSILAGLGQVTAAQNLAKFCKN